MVFVDESWRAGGMILTICRALQPGSTQRLPPWLRTQRSASGEHPQTGWPLLAGAMANDRPGGLIPAGAIIGTHRLDGAATLPE